MGFLDGLKEGLTGSKSSRETVDMYHDIYDDDKDYRSVAFDNYDSNNGWYTCARCGKKFRKSDMDVDHIVPQSCGGSGSRYNLQLLCKHCNRSKQDDTSDTEADLKRRRREIRQQDKEDIEYLNKIRRS